MPSAEIPSLFAIEKVASVDYLDQVFACYREGRVAVPVDRGAPPPVGYDFAGRVTPQGGGGWFTLKQEPIRDDRPAQVSFSSGTTGTPKAILLSHRALADVTDRLIAAMEIDGEIAEYLGVPPTYSFGLARARVTAAVGGRLFIPEHGFDPIEFARMLEADEVNALAAVPTLLRALIANPDLIAKKVARRLRWLEIGSQPMTAEEKHAIRRMFPAARIVQHYGLTEASRTTFLDIQEASDEELASVGRPIGATEIAIGAAGAIRIRGPHVADGLLTPDGLVPLADGEGWLTTNDIGRIENGTLFFEGRSDDLINCGGVKVPAETFERALSVAAGGAVLAAGPMPDPQRGERIAVACVGSAAAVRGVVERVAQEFGVTAAAVSLFETAELPRTETGKVQRRGLAALAAAAPTIVTSSAVAATAATANQAPAIDDRLPRTDAERQIAALWEQALKVSPIYRDETFFSMGGDSLSAINVLLIMDRAGIPGELSRRIFEGRTIAELAAESDGSATAAEESGGRPNPIRMSAEARVNQAVNIARGFLVLVVLAGHWGPFILVRSGTVGATLSYWLNPYFRFGTPGFALVFGLGVGYFQYHGMKRSREGVMGRLRISLTIVGGGIIALAIAQFIERFAVDGGLGAQWAVNLFYSILLFYLFAVLSVEWVLKLVDARPNIVLNAVIVAITSYALYASINHAIGDGQLTGFAELVRLMVSAKYSFFAVFGTMCLGIAMGLWIRLNVDRDDLGALLVKVGATITAGGVLLSITESDWHLWFTSMVVTTLMEITYLGIVTLILGLVMVALTREKAPSVAIDFTQHILALLGILAFPIYVGHKLVIPLKNALAVVLPETIALLIPLSVFVALFCFAMMRLNRVVNAGRWLSMRRSVSPART